MRIRRFNESFLSHEMTDYFLDLIEVEGFTYEPNGTLIRLFYSGVPKDLNKFFLEYMDVIDRLESAYGIINKSIRIEDTKEVQAIEIKIQLEEVDDFRIEFIVNSWSGDKTYSSIISGCQLRSTNGQFLDTISLYLSDVKSEGRKIEDLTALNFKVNRREPFSSSNCQRLVSDKSRSTSIIFFDIDVNNIEKVLNMIKSKHIRTAWTGDSSNPAITLPLLNNIKAEDLASKD
jgi:hypothetical protein